MIFKSQELYYIVFMYKYYQVNLFLILIEKVDQTFNNDWSELSLIRAKYDLNGEKT